MPLFIYLFIYLLLKSYQKYKIDGDGNITHDIYINIKEKNILKKTFKTYKPMHMQHTVHETHILKIIFISSRGNHPGSARKLSLTIMISGSRSATAPC